MVNRRKQRIVSVVLVATLVPAMVAFLVYLFATDSPDALPLLLNMVGLFAGVILVYLVDRVLRTRSSAARWIRGIVLAVMCATSFAVQAALPFDGAPSDAFVKGLGAGAGLTAFSTLLFGVLLPPESPTGEGR